MIWWSDDGPSLISRLSFVVRKLTHQEKISTMLLATSCWRNLDLIEVMALPPPSPQSKTKETVCEPFRWYYNTSFEIHDDLVWQILASFVHFWIIDYSKHLQWREDDWGCQPLLIWVSNTFARIIAIHKAGLAIVRCCMTNAWLIDISLHDVTVAVLTPFLRIRMILNCSQLEHFAIKSDCIEGALVLLWQCYRSAVALLEIPISVFVDWK